MTHRSQINMLNEKQSSEQTILSESADVHKEKKPFTKRDHDIAVVFEASQEEVIELFESVAALMYSFDDLGISSWSKVNKTMRLLSSNHQNQTLWKCWTVSIGGVPINISMQSNWQFIMVWLDRNRHQNCAESKLFHNQLQKWLLSLKLSDRNWKVLKVLKQHFAVWNQQKKWLRQTVSKIWTVWTLSICKLHHIRFCIESWLVQLAKNTKSKTIWKSRWRISSKLSRMLKKVVCVYLFQ